jgi:enolase-phosphatase E1
VETRLGVGCPSQSYCTIEDVDSCLGNARIVSRFSSDKTLHYETSHISHAALRPHVFIYAISFLVITSILRHFSSLASSTPQDSLLTVRGKPLLTSFQFPYSLASLPDTLTNQWDTPAFSTYQSAFPEEHRANPETFSAHVQDLTARDVKAPYLKALQGYLWLAGYENGDLKCPIFEDVYPALKMWKAAGKSIVIYSSGSVAAQKLLFQYTNVEGDEKGDLRGLLSGYFDTVNAGFKTEKESYAKIFEAVSNPGASNEKDGEKDSENGKGDISKWLFLSDNVKEVNAAKEAGMQSFVVVRDGNAPLSKEDTKGNVLVESFAEIQFKGAEDGKK